MGRFIFSNSLLIICCTVNEMLESSGRNDLQQEKYLKGADQLMMILSEASMAGSPMISLRNDDSRKLAFFFS